MTLVDVAVEVPTVAVVDDVAVPKATIHIDLYGRRSQKSRDGIYAAVDGRPDEQDLMLIVRSFRGLRGWRVKSGVVVVSGQIDIGCTTSALGADVVRPKHEVDVVLGN